MKYTKQEWNSIKEDVKSNLDNDFDFSETAIEDFYCEWFSQLRNDDIIMFENDMPIDLENLTIMMYEIKNEQKKI